MRSKLQRYNESSLMLKHNSMMAMPKLINSHNSRYTDAMVLF